MKSPTSTFSHMQSITMVVVAGVFLSTLGLGTRLLEATNSLQLVFYRSVGLVPTVLLFIWLRRGDSKLSASLRINCIGLLCSLCLVGTSIFVVMALTHTSVANAMFVISLAPLAAGIFARLIVKEQLSKVTLLAIAISAVGVLVIVNGALSSKGIIGIIYAFGMLCCYGLFSVTLRLGKEFDMLPCIALHGLILVILLGLYLPSLSIPKHDLAICLLLGSLQLGVGLTLITLASPNVPAAQLVLLAMLEVVLAPIWVWIGVGETPSNNSLIGGVIIIIAICIILYV